jgi:hypothetical protein
MSASASHVRTGRRIVPVRIGAYVGLSSARLAATLAVAWTAALPSAARAAEPDPPAWSWSAGQEFRYASWTGTRGFPAFGSLAAGSGAQVYAPLTVQLFGQPIETVKLELLARAGSVWSRQSTPELTGTVATATDTVLSGTATYVGIAGIQPFVSLNVNLPTGQAALYGSAANARMDSDIVDLATFGEGLNVGPTVGVNIPITETLMLTLSSGYTWRGAYHTEGLIDPDTLEQPFRHSAPGRVATQSISLGYQFENWMLQVSSSYTHETVSYVDFVPSYAMGDRYLVSGTATYAWTPSSRTTLTASWTNAARNRVLDPDLPMIVPEAFLSNSAVYRTRLEHALALGAWSVAPMANYMLRDQNSYNPVTYQFIPAKTRIGTGISTQFSVNDKVALKASAEHFWIREDLTALTPDLRVQGWIAMVGGNVNF